MKTVIANNLNELIQINGGQILTANQRQTRFLQQAHNHAQQTQQQSVWEPLATLPLSTWLTKQLTQLQILSPEHNQLLLLNSQQIQLLWQQIINQSKHHHALLNINNTAQLAIQAHHNLLLWKKNLTESNLPLNDDQKTFLTWQQAFIQQCQREHFIIPHQLYSIILSAVKKQLITLPEILYLYGFDELPPLAQTFFTELKNLNIDIINLSLTINNQTTHQIAFNSPNDEIKQMAHWVKHHHDQHPQQSIICVFPNLSQQWSLIKSAFEQAFKTNNADNNDMPFNISAGSPLANTPIIKTALKLLSLRAEKLALTDLTFILRSPFIIKAEAELFQRAELDTVLHEYGLPEINLITLLNLADEHDLCLDLCAGLKDFFNLTANKMQTPSQWAHYFSQRLVNFGWPGQRGLSSEEHQAWQRWQSLLTDFSRLELIHPTLNYGEALALLNQLCVQHVFQAESKNKPIQVLGVLEASGLSADVLWVANLHNEIWPPPAQPNPFIPQSLQTQFNMPHATAERELDFCQRLTERFTHSAETVLFSYPMQQDDQDLLASHLIIDYPTLTLKNYILNEPNNVIKNHLESIQDNHGLPFNEITVKGGAQVLKAQAACPFKAYVTYRLDAQPRPNVQLGLAAWQKGALMHKVLELCWRDLKTQTHLSGLMPSALTDLINQKIKLAIKQSGFVKTNSEYIKLEKQRLLDLLLRWFELEKQRPDFAVSKLEFKTTYQYANTSFNLQIDRLDRFADGGELVIDYKSGLTSTTQWFGERPDEPQMPLYALLTEAQALSFAQLKTNNLCFKGVSETDVAVNGIKPLDKAEPAKWREQMHAWRVTINELITQFKQGYAAVDPKSKQTCDVCELQGVCRVGG